MDSRITTALWVLLAGTVGAGALIGVGALNVVGCLWGVALLCAIAWRLPREDIPRTDRNLCWLFAVANALWLAADALGASGLVDVGSPELTAIDAIDALGTLTFCAVIAWVGAIRGRWPDWTRQVDGVVFAAALFAPLWFAVIQPQGASPELVVWGLGVLALLGFGATYVVGGGKWNTPAVLLALGVVGNIAVDLAIRVADPTGDPFAARHGVGFVLWTFVALHPQFLGVLERGHRSGGIPHDARVWFLPASVGLPIAVLVTAYINGSAPPSGFVAVALGVTAVLVAIRTTLERRTGGDSWHVSLMIAVSTLVAALAAICLTLASQSAERSDRRADRMAATIPAILQLDDLLLDATSAPQADAASARTEWERAVDRLGREFAAESPSSAAALDDYAARGRALLTTPDRPSEAAALTAFEYQRLLDAGRAAQRAARATAATESTRARVLNVAVLLGALSVITLLLVRFSFSGRRVAVERRERQDALTGLPSRAAIEHRLRRGADAPLGAAPEQTLVLLDLDDFKVINDVHGHAVGDALLCAVAGRLDALTRGDELLARVEGDAFAVLIEGEGRADEAAGIAQRMTVALAEPFLLGGEHFLVEGSIGIALGAAAGGADVGDDAALVVLRNAELAMYEAKRLPGTTVEYFAPAMHAGARDRLALTADLRRAIAREELHLVYQPIVDLKTNRVLGYEALARWHHPVRGLLSPAEFIPLAEATGLIVPLGGWALREACRQVQLWQQTWGERRYISVNVAGQQLAAGVLPEQVRSALFASGLPAEQLLLEVTESSLIESIDSALGQMAEVKALGARFALDDFGTGYSSLSYLRQFRVDVVKVDKSFIDDVIERDGSSLVEAIVHLASSLRMMVVAEGIEADAQAEELRRLGCDLGQGYRFSRPLQAGDVLAAPSIFGSPLEPAGALRVTSANEPRVA
ncbi:MAG: bifunctional diguanylate cyclase/phosphodiesterase [Solirubrobacteraceae bacterium]|nr:bifunctional diguanylate cyclase/phosphodiesterase [Solirubrobacteraceae bacterium]